MKPFEFSHVYVIESLHPNDCKTGTELFNDVIRPNMMKRGLEKQCALFEISSKVDFLQTLGLIRQKEIFHDVNPIIHFEMYCDKKDYNLQVTKLLAGMNHNII